jgi:hypothetical protein
MGLAILEWVIEIAGEWVMLQFCDLLVAGWHAIQSWLSQVFL